jgi:uncharacterized membrane protein YtjA (UPF0391 family)
MQKKMWAVIGLAISLIESSIFLLGIPNNASNLVQLTFMVFLMPLLFTAPVWFDWYRFTITGYIFSFLGCVMFVALPSIMGNSELGLYLAIPVYLASLIVGMLLGVTLQMLNLLKR